MESLRGIGAMARESGLSVSALRFYDGAGLLEPAVVDPRSGYRFYAADQLAVARLVAGLRRVGMPLAGIREVLAHRGDPVALDELLAAHLDRLEQGLVDARRELSSIRSLLEEEPVPDPSVPSDPATTTTVRLPAAELAAALAAVRFAVGSDPQLPVLGAVLFDITTDELVLVATDRYRLAVSPAVCREVSGPPVGALVPVELADRIAERLAVVPGEVAVVVRAGTIAVGPVGGALLPDAFPDYRPLVAERGRPVPVDPALRSALAAAPTRTMTRDGDRVDFEAAVLGLTDDGLLTADGPVGEGGGGIGVNREFLLQALDAGGPGQLELLLDGPRNPLVVRSPRSVSLLMPVRI